MNTPKALILGLLMLGSTIQFVESQRAPNKWWNELKSYQKSVQDSGLSDDQLLTEASRLSSNLVRVPAPSTISEKRVQFDDQPYDSIGSESQFMRRQTLFDSTPNSQDNSRDRIWSYFDSKLSKFCTSVSFFSLNFYSNFYEFFVFFSFSSSFSLPLF